VRCIADSAVGAEASPAPESRPAVTLREFRAMDLLHVVAIVAEALHEHYDPALYGSLATEWPRGFLIAADTSDVPAGFLLGVNQVAGEARVLMFAIDRQRRSQGIGTLLMSSFLERCRERGFRRVTLEVRVSNATAIRFYSRYQFSAVDLLRSYYSDGENGYQMARDLR